MAAMQSRNGVHTASLRARTLWRNTAVPSMPLGAPLTWSAPVSNAERYVVKYVNGQPGNTAKGMYTVGLSGVLVDVETSSGYLTPSARQHKACRIALCQDLLSERGEAS